MSVLTSAAADVVVVGGGPAGAICATLLASRGHAVTVLDRATFPRFRLGESLLPESLPVLDEVGVLPAVEERFLRKYGARFHDDIQARNDRFSFVDAWQPRATHAFEVPRDAFDALLLDHARARGVTVKEGWKAQRIHRVNGRATGVDALTPSGEAALVSARFVVDASGRDLLSGRGRTSPIAGLDQTALYTQYEGVPRAPGLLEGDIDIVLFDSGHPTRPNWFWFIPFNDGRSSVGAVVSRAWLQERRERLRAEDASGIGGAGADALLHAAITASSTATRLLADARPLWPAAQAAADFSYSVAEASGEGWLAIGDAAGFIDPLFSSGVHLAISGGKLAADAIHAAFEQPSHERALIGACEARIRQATETFTLAVKAFYAGPLVDYLFVADKRAPLRRSVTSLLAGDVFGDAVWLRDTRRRLEAMLASAP